MIQQALYLRITPGVTSCCAAMAAVELHRQEGHQDVYCAACLANITAIGGVRKMALMAEWPWIATVPRTCGTCGSEAGPMPAVDGNGYLCDACVQRKGDAVRDFLARESAERKRPAFPPKGHVNCRCILDSSMSAPIGVCDGRASFIPTWWAPILLIGVLAVIYLLLA
jgi:hypothetical protein